MAKKDSLVKNYRRTLRGAYSLKKKHTYYNRTSKAPMFLCEGCENSYLKRVSSGIWYCKSCKVSFSGNCYQY